MISPKRKGFKEQISILKNIDNLAMFLFFPDISKTKTGDLRSFAMQGHTDELESEVMFEFGRNSSYNSCLSYQE